MYYYFYKNKNFFDERKSIDSCKSLLFLFHLQSLAMGFAAYPVYRAQYGGGMGGMLRGFLTKGLASLGKRALHAGAQILDQTSQGVSLKDALKKEAKAQFKDLVASGPGTFSKAIKGVGQKRKLSSIDKSPKKLTAAKKPKKLKKLNKKSQKKIVL